MTRCEVAAHVSMVILGAVGAQFHVVFLFGLAVLYFLAVIAMNTARRC